MRGREWASVFTLRGDPKPSIAACGGEPVRSDCTDEQKSRKAQAASSERLIARRLGVAGPIARRFVRTRGNGDQAQLRVVCCVIRQTGRGSRPARGLTPVDSCQLFPGRTATRTSADRETGGIGWSAKQDAENLAPHDKRHRDRLRASAAAIERARRAQAPHPNPCYTQASNALRGETGARTGRWYRPDHDVTATPASGITTEGLGAAMIIRLSRLIQRRKARMIDPLQQRRAIRLSVVEPRSATPTPWAAARNRVSRRVS